MKKRLFLCFGLYFLLFNNLSFPMEPRAIASYAHRSEATPYISKHLDNMRYERKKAKKVIDGVPIAKIFVEGVIKRENIRQEEQQKGNILQKGDRRCLNVLISGPDGSGKKTLVRAIAKYLNRELITVSPAKLINIHPYSQQEELLQNLIEPRIQRNDKCVFFIKNVDLLQSFFAKDDQGVIVEHNACIQLRDYIEEAEAKEECGRDHFIFLATTYKKSKIEQNLLDIFDDIELGYPGFNRRKDILIDLLLSDEIIDSHDCISDQDFIDWIVEKTDGFSIRDLSRVVDIAMSFALVRIPQKGRGSERKICLLKDDLLGGLREKYPYTNSAREYQEFTKQCWFLRRWWRGAGAIK